MSEYIVELPDKPAKVVRDGWNVRIEWDFKQREEIVRCRDCRYYNERTYNWLNGWVRTSTTCSVFDGCHVNPDGFCAWGERRFTTCKCGESIELGDRESAVCPSCGRKVRE